MAGRKSSATVQQMQPLASSITSASRQPSMPQPSRIARSTPRSPNSLISSASRRPPLFSSRCRIRLVLPAPRKPVTTVAGIFAVIIGEPREGRPGRGQGGHGGAGPVRGTAKQVDETLGRRPLRQGYQQQCGCRRSRIDAVLQADEPGHEHALGIAAARGCTCRKAPIRPSGSGSNGSAGMTTSTGAPRPDPWVGSRDGRSPGSRVTASIRLPGPEHPVALSDLGSPLTVAGAAPDWGQRPAPTSLSSPDGHRHRVSMEQKRHRRKRGWRSGSRSSNSAIIHPPGRSADTRSWSRP